MHPLIPLAVFGGAFLLLRRESSPACPPCGPARESSPACPPCGPECGPAIGFAYVGSNSPGISATTPIPTPTVGTPIVVNVTSFAGKPIGEMKVVPTGKPLPSGMPDGRTGRTMLALNAVDPTAGAIQLFFI